MQQIKLKQKHIDKAFITIALASQNCPVWQALHEQFPDKYIVVGYTRCKIGNNNYYSLDDTGKAISEDFIHNPEHIKPTTFFINIIKD